MDNNRLTQERTDHSLCSKVIVFFRMGDKILLTLGFIKNVWLLVLGWGGRIQELANQKKIFNPKKVKERKSSKVKKRTNTAQRKSP